MNTSGHTAAPVRRISSLIDRGEQLAVVAFWAWLCWRVLFSGNPFAPLLLVGETLVLVFVLLRRASSTISLYTTDWAIAFAATLLPLLVNPDVSGPQHFAVPGVLLFMFGTGWQLWAKLVLRRSFGIAPANRGVKIGGPYRGMRHPMYFGYFVAQLAILILMFSPWNLAIYVAAWALQIIRLKREEDLLMQDPAYREFALQVPYRLIPRVF